MRGPMISASIAPANSPSIGPVEMIDRERPLRRPAPSASAVTSACVAMFSAAKERPQSSRAISNGISPVVSA